MSLKDFFSFKGRMRRKDYIAVYLVIVALVFVISVAQKATTTNLSLLRLLLIALIVPSSVRRLHDIGYSGWLVIGVLVIPFASLVLLLAAGEPGSNAHGMNPKTPSG